AFKKAFTISNIRSRWKSMGLYPFKPRVILDIFHPKIDKRPFLSKSLPLHLIVNK
ncbi:uncharacterized protein K441DRAFT_557950, partial [Cenococcum geophilum 1.58]|uniref:uncharacterized protein n=1 Tax=Cenococcum geophilum 1.58 TaxID=794803 RepID=UPI00358EEC19